MVEINNSITLQWGHLQIFSTTAGKGLLVTLPTSYSVYAIVVINAGVGTSGWTYMNGIQAFFASSTQIDIYHCLGNANPNGEFCSYIAIGY